LFGKLTVVIDTQIFAAIPETSFAVDVIGGTDNGGGHKGSSERENELHGALNEWVSGSTTMLTFNLPARSIRSSGRVPKNAASKGASLLLTLQRG
jgi:hypothetical protein